MLKSYKVVLERTMLAQWHHYIVWGEPSFGFTSSDGIKPANYIVSYVLLKETIDPTYLHRWGKVIIWAKCCIGGTLIKMGCDEQRGTPVR